MWVGEAGACTAVRRAGQGYNALEGPAIAKGAGGVVWAAHLLDKLDDALSVAQLHHACRGGGRQRVGGAWAEGGGR